MTGKLIYVHTTSQSIVFKKYTLIQWHEIDLHIDISVYTGDYNDGKLIYVHTTSQSIVFKRISGLIRWRRGLLRLKVGGPRASRVGTAPRGPLSEGVFKCCRFLTRFPSRWGWWWHLWASCGLFQTIFFFFSHWPYNPEFEALLPRWRSNSCARRLDIDDILRGSHLPLT